MTVVTRFAPSPTGRLHIGHAYSALFAHKQAAGGTFILRIEDIDPDRCRPEFEQGIYEDLAWLGLTWETPVRRQSEHIGDYKAALDKLQAQDLLYPCFCTRKDIADEIARSGVAPHGPEGQLYPGICRALGKSERADKIAAGIPHAWRLDMKKALLKALSPAREGAPLKDMSREAGRGRGLGEEAVTPKTSIHPHPDPLPEGRGSLSWFDRAKGWQTATPEILGDVVLARKDVRTSYHLSVTVDDHLQGVTLVTRGEDLFYATHLHRLLQELLGLDVPEWHHHKLLLDHEGKRFAKRNNAVTLQHMREVESKTAAEVLAKAGF